MGGAGGRWGLYGFLGQRVQEHPREGVHLHLLAAARQCVFGSRTAVFFFFLLWCSSKETIIKI